MYTILLAEKEISEEARRLLKRGGRVIDFVSPEDFRKNLMHADAIITGLDVKLDKATLMRAQKLKIIGSRTTQLRYIDLSECSERKIRVINITPDSSVLQRTPSTAEETLALILALLRKIPWAFDSLKNRKWERQKYGGHELLAKTIGLVGFGRLGRMVAKYCRAFGMRVIAFDPDISHRIMKRYGVQKVGLNQLMRISDIVSLHAVYNEDTYHMLQRKQFRLMKPTAIFINTARGEMTDERALLDALKKKWIAGAALDTLSGELPGGSHLVSNRLIAYARAHENLLILAHLGGATKEATERTQVYIGKRVLRELQRLRKRNRR